MSSSDPNPLASKNELLNPAQRPESPSGSSFTTTLSCQTTSLGGLSATVREGDDDDDGFKTPTDFDHRVPEARPCPPAPRKPTAHPKRRPIKRKSSADDATWMNRSRPISLLLDLAEEVESMYPPVLGCKIKKARTV